MERRATLSLLVGLVAGVMLLAATGAHARRRSMPLCVQDEDTLLPDCQISPDMILPLLTNKKALPKNTIQAVLVAVSARAAICPGLSKAQCPSLYCVWADGACSYSLQVDPLATLPLTPPACPGTKMAMFYGCAWAPNCTATPAGMCMTVDLPAGPSTTFPACLPMWLAMSGKTPAEMGAFVAEYANPTVIFNQSTYDPDLWGCCAAYLSVLEPQKPGCGGNTTGITKAQCAAGSRKYWCKWAAGGCWANPDPLLLPLGGALSKAQMKCRKLKARGPGGSAANCAKGGNITVPYVADMVKTYRKAAAMYPEPPAVCPTNYWDAQAKIVVQRLKA